MIMMMRESGRWAQISGGHGGALVLTCLGSLWTQLREEVPVEAFAVMGRQEADNVWKKNTENIYELFEFMEELGS